MGDISRAHLLAQLRAARSADRPGLTRWDPEALCFEEQRRVLRSRHRRKALRCGRRAGKSRVIAVKLLRDVLSPPYTNVFYIAPTLKNARRILWAVIRALNNRYELGGVPNETEASLRFPHLGDNVNVYFGGAKDATEVDKWRGIEGKLWVCDEFQAMPQRVAKPLLREAIGPAAMDHQGEIVVSGTASPLQAGVFWDIDSGELRDEWEHHRWSVRQNTLLPARTRGIAIEDIIADVLRENHWTPENATYLREIENQWVTDISALVFKYLAQRNHFDQVPDDVRHFVMAVDLGFEDADAIGILGWGPHRPDVYLVEERVDRKATITDLVERMRPLYEKYRPIKLVMDFGGLGKKIAEEITRRWGLPCEPAEKARKLEHIALLNDALEGGRFWARKGGQFAEDAAIMQWDPDKKAKGVLQIAEDYHSDITDVALYGFRACYGYLAKPPRPAPADEGERLRQRLYAQQRRARDPVEAALGYED